MSPWCIYWSLQAEAGPIVTDTFGGDSGNDIQDWAYKLDAIDVVSTVRLITVSPSVRYAPSDGDDELYFTVYEETTPESWDLIWDSGPETVGQLPGFKRSPEINLILSPGTRYAIGMWFPDGNYEYEYDAPAIMVDRGWAVLAGALWSGENTTYSLPNSVSGAPDTNAYLMQIQVEILDVDGDGVLTEDDCDDEDPTTYPGALELCDGVDNDCTGAPDDPVDHWYWYRDDDGDGHGNPDEEFDLCTGEAPQPGWVETDDDCDDDLGNVYPGAPEHCDGLDEDCSGVADDDLFYTDGWSDLDGDGFGDPQSPMPWCELERPAGIADNDLDCDDTDPLAFPDSVEVCDGADDDCDGSIDENLPTTIIWRDLDGDGHGDALSPFEWCEILPPDGSNLDDDCDDTDAMRFPGNPEVCDGIDNNCDDLTTNEEDLDGDGSFACIDCRDDDPTTFPGAVETCDGSDHDCDGVVPEPIVCDPDAKEDVRAQGCGCDTGTSGAWWLLPLAALAARRHKRGSQRPAASGTRANGRGPL